MKDFFAAIADIVAGALLKVYDGLKSFRIKILGADIVSGAKSCFSSSDGYDDSVSKKKIIIVGSVAAILVAIACIKLFWPSSAPGAERIELAAAATQDANGDVWSLQLSKGQSSQIIAQAEVKPGPPLLVRPEVVVRGRIVDVSVVMQGQAGEKYVPGVQRNDKWLPAPKFSLISESGKVIAQDQFVYG